MMIVCILLVLILGIALYTSYTIYKNKQLEQDIRTVFRKLTHTRSTDMFNSSVSFKNQYPILYKQVILSTANKSQIGEKEIADSKKLAFLLECVELYRSTKSANKNQRKIFAKVIQEDNITLVMTYKDKFGQVIFENKQPFTNCDGFSELMAW